MVRSKRTNLGAQIVDDEGVRPLLLVGAGRDPSDRSRRRGGTALLGLRRQALPRLRVTARQREHRPPAPEVVAAIKEQADKLCTIGPPMASESRSQLGRLLAEVTPGDLTLSFFTNGGAEANENAIKLARLYTGRHKIVARYRSYHGATHGAMTLTGDPRRWPAEPSMAGVVRMLDLTHAAAPPATRSVPGLHRCAPPRGDSRVRGRTRSPRSSSRRSRGRMGHPPPDGYLQSIREACDRHGILLILDEVMAGFGRTWALVRLRQLVPDISTVAKESTPATSRWGR